MGMFSIFLYTKKGITYDDVIDALKNEFKNKKKIQYDTRTTKGLNYSGFGYGEQYSEYFIMYFDSNTSMLDAEMSLTEEELAKVPFVGHWLCIDFRNEEYAKRIVECLLPLYPEMYVEDDYGSIFSASEYLKTPYTYESTTHKIGEYFDPNNKCD